MGPDAAILCGRLRTIWTIQRLRGLAGQAEEVRRGGATFRATGDGYHYNLSTQGVPAGRYRIIVSLDDGTTQSMDIILR